MRRVERWATQAAGNGTARDAGVGPGAGCRLAALVLAAVIGLSGGAPAGAQTPARPAAADRPVVGLALSGGGARGLAHVGVLRWLQEHRVPVDRVAGTSMGAVVGAMWATGDDSEEILEFLRGVSWAAVLRGGPAYADLSFRRKEDLRQFPSRVELGLRGGLELPAALNPGHTVGLLLDQVAFPYSTVDSFDALPTPFRCVATDLVEGRQVLFDRGPLGLALRASMAFPGLFAPIRLDDRVLADGGILNNLPTDVVRQMGADVVVAVDLGEPRRELADLASFTDVADRALEVMTRANVEPRLETADVVVEPAVSDFGLLDFAGLEELVERGYQAAAARARELRRWALEPADWQAYLAERRRRALEPDEIPTFLQVEGVAGPDREPIRHALLDHLDRPVSFGRLHRDLTRITGWGEFATAGYRGTRRDGRFGLVIRVTPKRHGPPFLMPLLDIQGSRSVDTSFTAGARLTFHDVGAASSELRLDLTVGFRDLAAAEYYRPLGDGGWFVAPSARLETSSQLLFDGEERVADLQLRDALVGIDVGYGWGARAETRLGYRFGHRESEVKVGDPTLPEIAGSTGYFVARGAFDDLDSPFIPTRGNAVFGEMRWVTDSPASAEPFPRAELTVVAARPLADRTAAIGLLAGGTSFSRQAPPLDDFLLGGPLRLGALGQGELRGDHYVLGVVGVVHALTEEPLPVLGTPYVGGFWEGGDAFDRRLELFHDLSGGLLMETGLGVLFFGGAWGEGGRQQVLFSLGSLF